jgi:hypothetical protein
MKIKVCLAASLLAISSFSAFAADQKKAPEMSAQEKADMQKMMAAATPGEPHKKLATMVGTWDATVTMWPAAGAPPMTSTGVSTNKAVLGGRFIEEEFNGNFMGAPFSGVGYTGYDNVTKQYVGTWMDTMSTGVMSSTGKDDGANAMSFAATMSDPTTGKVTKATNKVTIVNKDKHIMETWGPGKDGKNFKMMEITYTRKKG